MLRIILVSTWRQARRHPRYVGLNVLGLALGLCVFLLLSQFVRYQHEFNRSIPDADLIARIDDTSTRPGRAPSESDGVSFYALPFLRSDFPLMRASTFDRSTTVIMQTGNQRSTQNIEQVDGDYLKTIPLKLAQGDAQTALDRPDAIVLSTRTARAVFGTQPAIGQTILIDEDGFKSNVTVTGILARPQGPVTIDPGALMITPSHIRQTSSAFSRWGSTSGSLYARFRSQAEMRQVERQLPDFLSRRASGPGDVHDNLSLGPHPEKTNRLSFVPLSAIRFHDIAVTDSSDGVDRTVVDGLGLIGMLVLGLAIANAINLATARSALRAREIAMRKTLGAPRSHLLAQVMGESLLLTAFAGLIALSLRELLLPAMAAMTGATLSQDYGITLALLAAAVLVTGFLAGLYPALILSSYRPAVILAASRMPSGGRHAARIRNGLVLAQFLLAALVAICTLIVDRQVEFIHNSDLGYDRSGILLSPQIAADDVATQHRILDALRATTGVQAATLSVLEPNISNHNYFNAHRPGERSVGILTDVVADQYQTVYRPHLLSGRWFDTAHGEDDGPGTHGLEDAAGPYSVVINERARIALGFATPEAAVGQALNVVHTRLTVIGVEDDLRFVSPHQEVAPLLIFHSSKALDAPVVTLRYDGADARTMKNRVKAVWNSLVPDTEGDFEQVSDRMSAFYEADQRQGYLFSAGSAVAIVIACIGLYGLASFAGARRRQEVGIRKALGATSDRIVALMLREFLTPVLLACIIACPLAWAAMRAWLSGFSQRITLSPLDFLVVIVGAVAIATLTVVGQTLRVARAAPAYALRAE